MKLLKPVVGIVGELLFCSFFIVLGFLFSFIVLVLFNPIYRAALTSYIREIL